MTPTTEAAGLMPKLPELPAEQVEALGRTFPGRLLGRTAALLALVTLVLGWYVLAENLLPAPLEALRGYDERLYNLLFFGLPFLIVAGQLGLEWWHRRRARRMRERLLHGEVRDPIYFRLTPYTPRDRESFARLDRAHERVCHWIEDAANPILFLTGDSGTGKSSLLQAHVIPVLTEAGWLVLSARSYADPLAALRTALTAPDAVWKKPPDLPDAYALLAQAAQRLAREGKRLCIVLDQFEEFVILLDPEARAGFAALLRRLAEEPVPGLRLVLVLRSEYEAALAEVGLPRLRQGENWFKLGAFTEPAARAFLQGSGLDLAPETFDRLLKGAAAVETTRGLYRPIVLNLLGLILARPAGRLPEGFDPERVIQAHLRESVAAPDLREDAAAILPRMITEAGTKRPVEEAALAGEARLPLARVRHCLLRLAEGGLVRPLGREQLTWEIAHDFIATQLGLLLGRLRPSLWRQALPYAVPILAALWLASAAVLGLWWPDRRIDAAIAALSRQGFTVYGSREAGFRITSSDLEEGAVAEAWPHLRLLSPAELTISRDGHATSLPALDGLGGLQRVALGGGFLPTALSQLARLRSLRLVVVPDDEAVPDHVGEMLAARKAANLPEPKIRYLPTRSPAWLFDPFGEL